MRRPPTTVNVALEPKFHAGWESAQRTAAAFLRGGSYPFSFSFAEADVVPRTLSEVAEGGEGGCNSELGFCGMSGKSGGRVGGVTGAGRCVLGSSVIWFGH